MSSRKKLTISLFAVVAVAVFIIIAVVNVLAAQKQTIVSKFKVVYTAGEHVVADVTGLYEFTSVQDLNFDPNEITGVESSTNITSSTPNTTPAQLFDIADAFEFSETNRSLVFKFTITNKSSQGFRATLNMKNGDSTVTYTETTFNALNLNATYWDGDSWENILGLHFDIDASEYGVEPEVHTFYIQVYVMDMEFDVNNGEETSLQMHWDFDTVSYGV